ncbi:MAG: tetratricopeptide repeat protein, partial [Cyanobacteriota bacterium]|nr:tetratricopeptide repeat protein [Cyanobacteriota bacterium]
MNIESVETYLKNAVQFQESGNFEQAINSYQQAIELAPNRLEIYQKLAVAFVLNGQLEAGIQAIETAINLDSSTSLRVKPDFAEVYLMFGNILQQQNQIELALWAYTQALDIQPNFTEAQANLGSMYYHLERFDEAIECYQKALGFNPNVAVIYWMLGNAFDQIEQFEQAIASYQKSIELQPNHVKSYLKLATILAEQAQEIQAVSYYEKVLKLQPNCQEAVNALHQLTEISGLTRLTFVTDSDRFEEGGVDLASPSTDTTETQHLYPTNPAKTEEIFVESGENISQLEQEFAQLKPYQLQAKSYINQGNFEQAIALCQQ